MAGMSSVAAGRQKQRLAIARQEGSTGAPKRHACKQACVPESHEARLQAVGGGKEQSQAARCVDWCACSLAAGPHVGKERCQKLRQKRVIVVAAGEIMTVLHPPRGGGGGAEADELNQGWLANDPSLPVHCNGARIAQQPLRCQ